MTDGRYAVANGNVSSVGSGISVYSMTEPNIPGYQILGEVHWLHVWPDRYYWPEWILAEDSYADRLLRLPPSDAGRPRTV